MKTGDSITDDHGQTWTVDTPLGRGLWSRSWAVRAHGGLQAVLKVPLRVEDLLAHADTDHALAHAQRLEAAASEVYEAARRFHAATSEDGVAIAAPLLSTVAGGQGLFFPRYAADLEARLQAGIALGELVRILGDLAEKLGSGRVHGNLRPSNILLDPERGLAVIDPRPAEAERAWRELERHAGIGRARYLPDEVSDDPAQARSGAEAGWDAWAICQILHRATLASPSSDDPRRGPVVDPPRGGLNRVALATLKDAAAARLKNEDANRRFASRATEKLGSLLGRGLSAERDPSPPFRFRSLPELHARLVEVGDLIHPSVTSVAKPVLATARRDVAAGVYDAGQPIEFSVNISTTSGVTAQEDIATGVQLRDLDGPEHARVRVPNARFSVKQYPSGRWRFTFTLPEVGPGRYQVRAAFMVKGGDGDALVSEANFQVRPVPGYVPPPSPASTPGNTLTLPDRHHDRQSARADGHEPLPGAIFAVPAQVPHPSRTHDDAPELPHAGQVGRAPAAGAGGARDDAEVIPFPRRGAGVPSPIRPSGQEEDDLDDVPEHGADNPRLSAPSAHGAASSTPPQGAADPYYQQAFDRARAAQAGPRPAAPPSGNPADFAPDPGWRPHPEPPTVASSLPPPNTFPQPTASDQGYGASASAGVSDPWAARGAGVAAQSAPRSLSGDAHDAQQAGRPAPGWPAASPSAPRSPGQGAPVAAPPLPPLADLPTHAVAALDLPSQASAPLHVRAPQPAAPPSPLPSVIPDLSVGGRQAGVDSGPLDYPGPADLPVSDLPVYDAPPPEQPAAWRERYDQFVQMLGGDPITAWFFMSAVSFIALVVIAAAFQRC